MHIYKYITHINSTLICYETKTFILDAINRDLLFDSANKNMQCTWINTQCFQITPYFFIFSSHDNIVKIKLSVVLKHYICHSVITKHYIIIF